MKAKLHVRDPLRIGGGAEDFALVILERLDPVGDIARVMRNVGRDAEFVATKAEASSARNSSIA